MGRYVGNEWREDLPSSGPADQVQGNNQPTSAPSGGGGGGGGGSSSGSSGGGQSTPSGDFYWTVNGPRTASQMEAELRNVGWDYPSNPSPEIIARAYADTTRAPTAPGSTPPLDYTVNSASAPTGRGGFGPNNTAVQPVVQQQQVQQTPQSNIEFFNLQAKELAARLAIAEATQRYLDERMRLIDVPMLEIERDKLALQRAVADADKVFRQADLDLRRLTADRAHEIATGQLTLAQLTEQHANELGIARLGLDAMELAASLHVDPFRQQEIINGLAAGGYSRAIDAALGKIDTAFGGQRFGAAGGEATLGNLAQRMGAGQPQPAISMTPGDARAHVPGTPSGSAPAHIMEGFHAPGAGALGPAAKGSDTAGNTAYNAALAAMPGSGKDVVARNYVKMDPGTKRFLVSGIKAKSGLDADVIEHDILNTLPKFQAPTGMVAAS